jgi:hypothetical protein
LPSCAWITFSINSSWPGSDCSEMHRCESDCTCLRISRVVSLRQRKYNGKLNSSIVYSFMDAIKELQNEKPRRDTKELKREKTNFMEEYSELIASLGNPPVWFLIPLRFSDVYT